MLQFLTLKQVAYAVTRLLSRVKANKTRIKSIFGCRARSDNVCCQGRFRSTHHTAILSRWTLQSRWMHIAPGTPHTLRQHLTLWTVRSATDYVSLFGALRISVATSVSSVCLHQQPNRFWYSFATESYSLLQYIPIMVTIGQIKMLHENPHAFQLTSLS
jgi:hypothetical protein